MQFFPFFFSFYYGHFETQKLRVNLIPSTPNPLPTIPILHRYIVEEISDISCEHIHNVKYILQGRLIACKIYFTYFKESLTKGTNILTK